MGIKPNETIIESDLDILGSKEEAWKASMRIHYLTDNYLIKKATTNGGWDILYQDPTDLRYWELTAPKGEYHGSGPLRLSYVSNLDAILKYNLDKL